jgi:hypothetical protein
MRIHSASSPVMTCAVEREAMPVTAVTIIARPDSQSSFVAIVFIVMQLQGCGSWFCIAHPANDHRHLSAYRQDVSRPW